MSDPSVPVVPGRPPDEPYTLAGLMSASPPRPTPPRRPSWVIPLIAGLAVLLLAVGGLATWALLLRPSSAPQAATSPGHSQPAQPIASVPAKTYGTPSPADFHLTIKTIEKKCYGSAGCLITFRVELEYSGPELDPDVTYEVTYKVTGAEDPMVNTLEVTGDQYSRDREETASTASSSSKLKVTVTEVGRL